MESRVKRCKRLRGGFARVDMLVVLAFILLLVAIISMKEKVRSLEEKFRKQETATNVQVEQWVTDFIKDVYPEAEIAGLSTVTTGVNYRGQIFFPVTVRIQPFSESESEQLLQVLASSKGCRLDPQSVRTVEAR